MTDPATLAYLSAITRSMGVAIGVLEEALPEGFVVSIVARSPDNPRAHLLMGNDPPDRVAETMREILSNPGHRPHPATAEDGLVTPERKH